MAMPRGDGLDTTAGANYGLESANNYVTYASLVPEAVNTFTVELWVNPYYTHEIDPESNTGYGGESGQRFILFPVYGGDPETGKAGMGISVGTNGISVYEHAGNYIPPLLVWQGTVSGCTHIAVVYDNKTPKLYVNGVLVHTGLTSLKSFIYPGTVFPGGQYGNTAGAQMDEVRIWDVARTQAQIQAGMSTEVPGNSEHLVAYWPMNEGSGTVLHDVTGHGHDVSLFQGGYPTSYWVSGALSLEHLSVGAYRYGFNGKEKDQDIGQDDYDFGARIYDARLGRWLSVDPLFIDCSEFSPYVFTGNNPVLNVDPDGRKIVIYYTELSLNLKTGKQEAQYKQYEYTSGLKAPNNVYVQETIVALNYLYDNVKKGVGKIEGEYNGKNINILNDLISSPKEVAISINENKLTISSDPNNEGTIEFNPYSGLELEDGSRQTPALGLLHEFGHTWGTLFDKKNQDIRKGLKQYAGDYNNGEEHFVITRIETPAAKVLNEPVRKNHGGKGDIRTVGSTTTETPKEKTEREAKKKAVKPVVIKKKLTKVYEVANLYVVLYYPLITIRITEWYL